ncbi:MAG TPA: SMR family transporter, partial [Burkholderiaceae bacterium]|nr:SMR family transporter [Burkholderiaceae bacterium]
CLKVIPIGTAYAVWGGIGAVGTVIVGLVAFGESASPGRLACIALVVAGVIGLQLQ